MRQPGHCLTVDGRDVRRTSTSAYRVQPDHATVGVTRDLLLPQSLHVPNAVVVHDIRRLHELARRPPQWDHVVPGATRADNWATEGKTSSADRAFLVHRV